MRDIYIFKIIIYNIYMSDTNINDFFEPDNNNENIINTSEKEIDDIDNNIIFGIDLGTTNSCISYWKNNSLVIIPDENGNKIIPSIVAFTNKSKYVGNSAKNQKEINTENVFYEVKRLIGRKYNDDVIQNEKELLSYSIDKDNNNNILLKSKLKDNKTFIPEAFLGYLSL